MKLIQPLQLVSSRRLGSQYDGGYVVPETVLQNSRYLLSFGYGNNFAFEKDFLSFAKENVVRLYDGDINLGNLMKRFLGYLICQTPKGGGFPLYRLKHLFSYVSLKFTPRLTYIPKFVEVEAYHPSEISFVETLHGIDFDSTILKMDIECAEWNLLENYLSEFKRFSCLIIEFHEVHLRTQYFYRLLAELKQTHKIANTHLNNFGKVWEGIPEIIEMTFIKKEFPLETCGLAVSIPSQLDSPCKHNRPELTYNYR